MHEFDLLCSKGKQINENFIEKESIMLSGENMDQNPLTTACNLTCNALVYLLSKENFFGFELVNDCKMQENLLVDGLTLSPMSPQFKLTKEKIKRWLCKYSLVRICVSSHKAFFHEFLVLSFKEKLVILESFIGKYPLKYSLISLSEFDKLLDDCFLFVENNNVSKDSTIVKYFPISETKTNVPVFSAVTHKDVNNEKIKTLFESVSKL